MEKIKKKINMINNDAGNCDNIYDVASHNRKWHGRPLYVTRFLLSKSDQIMARDHFVDALGEKSI